MFCRARRCCEGRGAARLPLLLAISGRVYPAGLESLRWSWRAPPCICRMKVFWSYCSSVLLPVGWPDKSYGYGIRTHRRSRNRYHRRIHWRLVAAPHWCSPGHRHCRRDRQCHHWRRHPAAGGSTCAGWWPLWGRLERTLGTPMVAARGSNKPRARRGSVTGNVSICFVNGNRGTIPD